MKFALRTMLFLATNLAIVLMISLVVNLLGLQPYVRATGLNYESLLIFCLMYGFAGSIISLLISRWLAKWQMGVNVLDPDSQLGNEERWLVQTVHRLAKGAGLSVMPEVGIYQSPELNAFATGPSKRRSLVAVSTGLLRRMSRDEVEGVLGHEVAHISNGDMVTMTLIQGVVNAFVMFFARIVASMIENAMRGDRDREPNYLVHTLIVFVLELAFGLIGMMIVATFSRWREFRADAGGAKLAGRSKMVAALDALRANALRPVEADGFATMKIFGGSKGLFALLSTHPPLEVRIDRLRRMV